MTTETMQPDASATPEEDAPLLEQIESLKAELEQLRAQSLLERADLENQRRRLERDVTNACRFANKQLRSGLLPVFDSMEAGLANAAESDPLRDGVVLTLRELHRVAESNGLCEIAPASGDAFDPEKHQAMSMVEAAGVAPGAVAQCFQKGYLLNDQLLRPALVTVSQHD